MSSVVGPVGSAISCMMIAVRPPDQSGSAVNAQLETLINRIRMQLYFKAHVEVPPSATDFGGGRYNIVV